MKTSLLTRINRASMRLLAGIVVLLSFLQYANTLRNDYTLDDQIVIGANPSVQKGFPGIPELWIPRRSQALSDQYGYRPLTLSTFAADIGIFGQAPRGGHLMNIVFFSLLCLAMLYTLRAVLPGTGKAYAFFATVLFAVHPIHVEAVANIKSRDEILALLFGLLAIQFAVGMYTRRQWWRGAIAVLLVGLGYLCKESALTFLAVLPLAVLIRPETGWKDRLRFALPLPLLTGLLLFGLIQLRQSATVTAPSTELQTGLYRESKVMGNAIFQPHETADRYATGTYILSRYLRNFLFPYPLVYYYGYDYLPLTSWSNPWVWFSLLIHLGLGFVAIRYFRRFPWLSFGLLYYFITVSPYTHFLRPLDDAMADRFLFSPSLGLIIAFLGALALLLRVPEEQIRGTENEKNVPLPRRAPLSRAFLPLLAVLVLAGSFRTAQRNTAWKDNLSLFSTDIRHLGESCARCNFHYADALSIAYRNRPDRASVHQTIVSHYRKAIEISPLAYNSYIGLANHYYLSGMTDQGIQVMEQAIAQFPEEARPHFHLGNGKMLQNHPAEALIHLEKARSLAPDREQHYFLLAWAYYQTGNQYKGIELMRYAQSRWPATLDYHRALHDMYWNIQEYAPAMEALVQLVHAEPGNREHYLLIISRYQLMGDQTNADHYRQMARNHGVVL